MFGFLTFFVLAQNLNTPLSDYQYQISQYQTNYSDYLHKKNIYQQYRDLSSQTDLTQSVANTILARNNLVKAYLILLSTNLDQYKSASPDDTTKVQNQIQDQIENLDNFNYKNLQQLFYQALTQHQLNRRQHLFNLYWQTASQLSSPQVVINRTETYQSIVSQIQKTSQKSSFGPNFSNFYPDVQNQLKDLDQLLNLIYKDLVQIAVKNN